nr:hypothetical protein [Tanacetum cinerariifolium]
MDGTRETWVISPTDLLILAGKKPGASGRVFAITEGQAANTSVREFEFNIELIPGAEPISKASYCMAPV